MADDELDLRPLAPEVDLDASRTLFKMGRDRRRRRSRAFRALAAIGLLALVVGSLLVLWPQDQREVATGSRGIEDVPFEVLLVAEATGGDGGDLRFAVDLLQLNRLWDGLGVPGSPPRVSLVDQVIVGIRIPSNACAPTLTGFEVEPGERPRITPTFVDSGEVCDDRLVAWAYLVAIDRVWAEPGFTLHLEARPPYAPADQRLDIDVADQATPAEADTTTTVLPPEHAAVAALVGFATERSAELVASVGFAPPVAIGLGPDLLDSLDEAQLADPSAWLLELDGRWGGAGSISALDLLARPLDALSMEVDRTTSCVGSTFVSVPQQLEGLERVSITPRENASCLDWFAVDVYLDDAGRIVAVTVELYEP